MQYLKHWIKVSVIYCLLYICVCQAQLSNDSAKIERLFRLRQLKQYIYAAHQRAKNVIVQMKITRKKIVSDGNLTMIFNLVPDLAKKDLATAKTTFDPFLNPEKALFIKNLGKTHQLLFNKFSIIKNHLLIVTKQFQKQTNKITQVDMHYTAFVRDALDGVLFFNGGNLSGASQSHKHLQVLPHQAKQMPIVSALQKLVNPLPHGTNKIIQFPNFHFIHGIIPIYPNKLGKTDEALYHGYNALYDQLITKNQQKGANISDYNMIATDNFILMVLRAQQLAFNKLSVNSVGFMGFLHFRDEKLLQQFAQIHPSSILQSICIKQINYN